MRGVPLNYEEVHRKIWNSRDRKGCVKIYQKDFAESLHISQYHMSRVISTLVGEGKLKKVGARFRNIGIYQVEDPAKF